MSETILIGTNKVTEAEVFAIPDVPFTSTFSPIHHRDVIRAVREGVQAVGMDVVKSEYVLAANGHKMFGVYDLSQGNSELCWSIGIRNSMNKSMSLGITAGTKVFVCENLCFSGEFLAFRRHTAGLNIDELAFLAYKSMRNMVPLLKNHQRWHEGLKNYSLSKTDLKVLLVEIMTNSVISTNKFNQFNEFYANVYDDSLWGFHETVTDILKGSNLLVLPQKNKILNQVINNYIDSLATASDRSPLGEFYQQRALINR